jgi:hypothetical protein
MRLVKLLLDHDIGSPMRFPAAAAGESDVGRQQAG